MKKLLFTGFAGVCLSLLAFVSPQSQGSAEVTSFTDPFTDEVIVCYTLPSEGNVEIKVVSDASGVAAGELNDKQGHGTHCAGISCAVVEGEEPGTGYTLDFSFEGEHQYFHLTRQ